jgi:hypothetical protein
MMQNMNFSRLSNKRFAVDTKRSFCVYLDLQNIVPIHPVNEYRETEQK